GRRRISAVRKGQVTCRTGPFEENCRDSSAPKERGLRMTGRRVRAALQKLDALLVSTEQLRPDGSDPSPGPRRLVKAPSRPTLSPAERAMISTSHLCPAKDVGHAHPR